MYLLREACWVNMWTQGQVHNEGLPNTFAQTYFVSLLQWELLAFLHRETQTQKVPATCLWATQASKYQSPDT